MEKYSQCGQDLILNKYFPEKYNGFFIDIGCGHPIRLNNTYAFEKIFKWSGISIDIENYSEFGESWDNTRTSKFIKADATSINYIDLFLENNVPYNVDYLTMDLEPPDLTLSVLFKIPFDRYTFNFITFETDENREGGERRKKESREYISSKGYILLGNIGGQDDIYIHKNFEYKLSEKSFCEVCYEIGVPYHIINLFNPECYGD